MQDPRFHAIPRSNDSYQGRSTQRVEVFGNNEFELQVVPDGESFKVEAAGVAHGLAYRDAWAMVRSLPEECRSKGYTNSCTPDDQAPWYLTESGLYRAVGQRTTSRIPDPVKRATAERFQSWIFDEVLPSLRRTGTYTLPGQRYDDDGFFHPHTLTWDEAAALMRQRYGMPTSVTELTRTLRTAGVLKQNGSPRKQWENLFWFTGSAWNVHPHQMPVLARKVYDTRRELHDFRYLQAQLELDGIGSTALLDTKSTPQRRPNVTGPAGQDRRSRGIEPSRPDDNRP